MEHEIIAICDNVKPHKTALEVSHAVLNMSPMGNRAPFAEQGCRLRLLRLAEGFQTGTAFASRYNWPQSGYSQFETGQRRIPADKALQLMREIPGFDPIWLWTGDKKGLSFDLRKRIEAIDAAEKASLFRNGRPRKR